MKWFFIIFLFYPWEYVTCNGSIKKLSFQDLAPSIEKKPQVVILERPEEEQQVSNRLSISLSDPILQVANYWNLWYLPSSDNPYWKHQLQLKSLIIKLRAVSVLSFVESMLIVGLLYIYIFTWDTLLLHILISVYSCSNIWNLYSFTYILISSLPFFPLC